VDIHPTAATGFAAAAELYERARPGYPDEAVAWMLERMRIGTDSTVLDLAAGTGKLTRQLVPLCGHVIAVEPVEEMGAQLEKAVPEAEALDGTAEAIPLADDSVDAVTCAQAFHWFRVQEALREIHRVLRRDGGVALIWNGRDLSLEAHARVDAVLAPLRPEWPVGEDRWRRDFRESGLYGPIELRHFRHSQRLTREEYASGVATTSFVAAMAPAERDALLDRVWEALAPLPEPIDAGFTTDVYVADVL
jgi:SAM-dependent methyltransferase